MTEIRCPMCGKPNDEGHEECRYCGARLKPLIASSPPEEPSYEPPPIPSGPESPGEEPTAPPPSAEPPGAPAPQDDWLSSLRQEGDDEESSLGDTGELRMDDEDEEPDPGTPDWLSRIGGEVEPGHPQEFETPSTEPPSPPPPAGEGIPDWLQRGPESEEQVEQWEPEREVDWGETPGIEDVPADAMETRDVPGLSFREEPGPAEPSGGPGETDVPDWLQEIRSEPPTEEPPPAEAPPAMDTPEPDQGDLPEWLVQPGAQEPAEVPEEGLETKEFPELSFPSEPEGEKQPPAGPEPADVPDWLQGLEPAEAAPPAPPPEPATQPQPPPAEEPADVPEWLRGLDPAGPAPPTPTEPAPSEEPPSPAEPAEVPEWLQGLEPQGEAAPEAPQPPIPPPAEEPAEAAPEEPTDLPDWMTGEPPPQEGMETQEIPGLSFREDAGPLEEPPPLAEDLPEWLQGLEPPGEVEEPPTERPEPEAPQVETPVGPPAEPADLPDWLSGEVPPGAAETVDIPGLSFREEAPEEESAAGVPDWLEEAGTLAGEESAALEEAAAAAGFRGLRPDESKQADEIGEQDEPWTPPEAEEEVDVPTEAFETKDLPGLAFDEEGQVERADTPEWLKDIKLQRTGAMPEEGDAGDPEWMGAIEAGGEVPVSMGDDDLPDWLRGLQSVQEEAISEVEEDLLQDIETPVAEPSDEELPDWLAELRAKTGGPAVPPEEAEPAETYETDAEVQPEEETIVPGQLPDWVSDMRPTAETAEGVEEELDLEPAELPGWLKAMRPVEAVTPSEPSVEGVEVDEGTIEGAGPLAGLTGILPAEPEIAQTGTPATFSMRVEVSKTQFDHITLLKELIKDEIDVEISERREPLIQTHHILRWIIALVLILAVGIPALTGLESTPGPELVPQETRAVGNIVGALTQGQTVLISFDYQPGLSAEIEAAGTSLLDHLMLLGTPMALVSTNTSGPALAERVFTSNQEIQDHGYVHGEQYINLGYIPGGAAGLQDFALSPRRIFPIPFKLAGLPEGRNVWATRPLQGVQQLSDFALVVVLTDDLNSARAWIEQVEPGLGETPLVVVSSAQTAPLLRPYYENEPRQIEGMISGLPGGMTYERLTGRSGQARRYWDAFNNGLMLVNLVILVGGAASVGLFLLRMREPTVPEESS